MNAKSCFTKARIIGMDPSRFRAAPIACYCSLCIEGQRAFPAEGRVPASWIVEAVEIFEDCDLGVSTRFPGLLPQQLSFDRLEEGFDHCPAGSCIAFFPEAGGVIIAVAGSG